jgi:AbrB family looped-hinge helix DNA binding protein
MKEYKFERAGETTITGKNQITLPAEAMRALGWGKGDHLFVELWADNRVILWRRPEDWVKEFSGKMGDVWGDHEDVMNYLEEERRSWDPE